MAKSKEHDKSSTTKNGVTTSKILPTQVIDGKLVVDETSPDNAVKQ